MVFPPRSASALALLGALAACGSPVPSQAPPSPLPPPGTEPSPPPSAGPPEASAQPPADDGAPVLPDVPAGADALRDAELARVAGAVVDAFANLDARFTPDGKRVVYRSNRDGLWQAYLSDPKRPEAFPARLVQTTERVTFAAPTRDGASLLFLSDRGADESTSIYRVPLPKRDTPGEPARLDVPAPILLTPGEPLQREPPLFAAGKGAPIVYSAHATSEVGTRVYAMDALGGAPPRLVMKDPSAGGLVDLDHDGKRALLVRIRSLSDASLALCDLAAGAARAIYPPAGTSANVFDAAFSADGKLVYVATDAGGEQALLLALDPATGAERARYVETGARAATLRSIAVAPKGGRLALAVDAGNHVEVRLLDEATLAPGPKVALPLGDGQLGRFSADGRRLTVSWSTPSAPMDILAVDAKTGAATALRNEARPSLALLPPIDASIETVASFDRTPIPVNVYRPAGARPGAVPMGVVVLVHGGPAASSTLGWSGLVRFFTGQGYAVVEPNVRGSTGFGRAYEQADDGPKRLDAVRDVEAVGRWAASQPWADPKRLVLMGGSYGGYMVLMGLTRHPDLWRAGVDLVGPSSWRSFLASTTGEIRDVLSRELGSPDRDGAFLDAISPLRDVGAIVAPLFVYQGQNDPRVPRAESDQIVRALRRRGVPVEYMIAAGEGHSIDRRETRVELFSRVARFLERRL
jgi:dipeptidyl aminopeptidase/acylaminoacyl peptidase